MNVGSKHNLNAQDKNKRGYFLSYFPFNLRIFITIFLISLLILLYVFFFRSSHYRVLYNNLSKEDERLILSQLTHMHIPFKFDDNHSSLMVPERQLEKVQVNLSEQGLPKSSNIGFELLDQEKFGISQFNEQINYQRALEGELARSIQQLNNIKTARVHIAFPKPSLFVQDKKFPSASIILGVKKDSDINFNQINAILHMVSSSVSGLSIENVTIIDQTGNLLNSQNSLNNNIDNLQLKYCDLIEERYKQRIENILIPLVGLNNVHAQVTAKINFDKQESTEEKYKPNYTNDSKSIRSHQGTNNTELNEKYTENSISSSSFPKKLKVLSDKLLSDSNHVNSTDVSDKDVNHSSILPKSSVNQDYIINYELDRTFVHKNLQMGNIERLSAAVVINYIRDKDGELISLNPYQISKIENLIRAVIGFSLERGDSISIVNSLFIKPPMYFSESSSFWDSPLLFNKLFQYGFIFVLVIICFLICKVVFFRKKLKNNNLDNIHIKNIPRDNKNKEFSSKTENSEKVPTDAGFSNFSIKDPHTIAMIIRKWMSGDKK
ncbi:MAG: flagellar basal-body MS-ring/collar protein FliF [Buchnera aphidicola (Nurudea yanoniella)]